MLMTAPTVACRRAAAVDRRSACSASMAAAIAEQPPDAWCRELRAAEWRQERQEREAQGDGSQGGEGSSRSTPASRRCCCYFNAAIPARWKRRAASSRATTAADRSIWRLRSTSSISRRGRRGWRSWGYPSRAAFDGSEAARACIFAIPMAARSSSRRRGSGRITDRRPRDIWPQRHRDTELREAIRRRGPAKQAHWAAMNGSRERTAFDWRAARSREPFMAGRAASRRAVESIHLIVRGRPDEALFSVTLCLCGNRTWTRSQRDSETAVSRDGRCSTGSGSRAGRSRCPPAPATRRTRRRACSLASTSYVGPWRITSVTPSRPAM